MPCKRREPSIREYRLMGKIGNGAHGNVYKATHIDTGLQVALKRVQWRNEDDGVPSTTIREIATLRELSKHPCIIKVLDVIMEDRRDDGESPPNPPLNRIYIVLEHMGMDLKQYMSSYGTRELLEVPLVQSFMYQIVHALCFCHMRRILHRDLKPQNLLVNSRGVVKLADFGLARTYGCERGGRVYTHRVATLWYRAPELLLGARTYSTEVDVWSLGTIFAELINNRPMLAGDSEIDQLYKIFQKLGTPKDETWPGVTRLAEYRETFPNWRPRPVLDWLAPARKHEKAADLLGLLLTLNPARRISAKAALHHPFFDDLDRSWSPLSAMDPYPLQLRPAPPSSRNSLTSTPLTGSRDL